MPSQPYCILSLDAFSPCYMVNNDNLPLSGDREPGRRLLRVARDLFSRLSIAVLRIQSDSTNHNTNLPRKARNCCRATSFPEIDFFFLCCPVDRKIAV